MYTLIMKRQFHSFGKNSVIKPVLNTSHADRISIGNDVNIGSFCRITVSTDFGGKKVRSKNTIQLKIGDNVDIGNNSFISANNNIQIGNHVIMSAYVFITDHDHGYENIHKNLHEQPLSEGGATIIGDNVFLGVKSSVLKNITIGAHSVVAANSVVTKDVPRYCVVAGNPAKILKRYDFKKRVWTKSSRS